MLLPCYTSSILTGFLKLGIKRFQIQRACPGIDQHLAHSGLGCKLTLLTRKIPLPLDEATGFTIQVPLSLLCAAEMGEEGHARSKVICHLHVGHNCILNAKYVNAIRALLHKTCTIEKLWLK